MSVVADLLPTAACLEPLLRGTAVHRVTIDTAVTVQIAAHDHAGINRIVNQWQLTTTDTTVTNGRVHLRHRRDGVPVVVHVVLPLSELDHLAVTA